MGVPSPETEAHLEGALNLWRFNRSDLFNVAVWIGLFVVVGVGVWLLGAALHLLPHSTPAATCNTVAQCNRDILSHPLHYHPPAGTPTIPPFGG